MRCTLILFLLGSLYCQGQGSSTGLNRLSQDSCSGLDVVASIEYYGGCDNFGSTAASATAVSLSGIPPYTYAWDDAMGQTTAEVWGLTIGKHSLIVTDSAGCTGTDTVEVIHKIQTNITVDKDPCPTCSDGEVTVMVSGFGDAPITYRWDDENEQTSATATGLSPGEYTVLVVDANGCYETDTVSIGITGIENVVHHNSIRVFPNPTTGLFKIDADITEVLDISGKLILSTTDKVVDLTDKPKGLYFVRALKGGRVYYSKVVLE